MTRRISEAYAREVDALFVAEADDLRRRASRLLQGDYAGADDLVQEVFHDAATAWDKLRGLDPICQRMWLFTVLRNKSISKRRADARVEVGPVPEILHHGHDETSDIALNSVELDRCWKILSGMPRARFQVAYLRWREGWSTAEIAQALGIKQSTVRVHLKEARDGLASAIGPNVTFVDDAVATDREGKEAAS